MPGKIFISYRRDDDPNAAARVRDGLVRPFGKANVFLDVDHLIAGQRFDEELAKALSQCDVLIAIIGSRWMELLGKRLAGGERDYVREEIGEALKRRIVVIPVRVGRDGQLAPLPRAAELPEDIRDLVHYQKHDVSYERFPRDIAELIDAIGKVRQQRQDAAGGGPAASVPWGKVAAAAGLAAVVVAGGIWLGTREAPPPAPSSPEQVVALQAEIRRRDELLAKLEADRKTDEAKRKADADAAVKAKAAADARAAADADTRRRADEAERQRIAMKVEEDRQKAAEAARTKAEINAMRPGRVFRDCTDGCPEMVVVPAGSFTMGSNDYDNEKPPRTVTIRQAFAVGKFEVTVEEFEAFVKAEGYKFGTTCHIWNGKEWKEGVGSFRSPGFAQTGKHPAACLNWNDAKAYVGWLSRKTGQSYRLLTEAEWEYAARAGTPTRYPWGNDIGRGNANCDGCGSQWDNKQTAPVGSFKTNAFGLNDMHGNVWEWVEDCYANTYNGAPTDGSASKETQGCSRVLRGGSWFIYPIYLRSSIRGWFTPGLRSGDLGLRLARTIKP